MANLLLFYSAWDFAGQNIYYNIHQVVKNSLLPPANEVCKGYVFTDVCLSTGGMRGGGRVWLGGVCAWLWGDGGPAWLPGGTCMVARGHAWLPGGICGFWGCAWLLGACMVVGGMCGCQGDMCGCGGACVGYDEIRSMSGRYASYWNAFLFL